jgi:hypothetical protein
MYGINQSWNDNVCNDSKEKDEKGTGKEKEEEGGREEEEEGGREEEEEEREKDDAVVGEKQNEKDVGAKSLTRHMEFSEDSSDVLMYSNSPSNTRKSKETTKGSQKSKTPGREGKPQLTWSNYTTFVHDAIYELYVYEREDQYGEFMMKKDFYYSKFEEKEFFRAVAAEVRKKVVEEKERREEEEKKPIKEVIFFHFSSQPVGHFFRLFVMCLSP